VLKRLLIQLRDAFEERTGLGKLLGDLANHPVPPDTGWWYVFGSATLVAFAIQVVTGMALATAYISSSGDAYQALEFITTQALLGNLLRGMHYFGASAMVLLVGIHMAQVFLMGCYKYPREVNWLTGVVLLFLTLGMGFTGQLLRWDQNAVWSVMVGAQQAGRTPIIGDALAYFILGGQTLGGATLSRFFAAHVFFIPAIIFLIVAIHLYLVIHDGISEPPVAGEPVDPATYRSRYQKLIKERGVSFWPDVAWRDAVAALLVVASVVLLAWIVGPPQLDPPPDPSALARDPRPDWYLVWYYAVLALIPHGLTTWVILLAPLVGILVLISVPFISNRGERHPLRRPWAIGAVLMIVMMIATLWIEGTRAPWSPDLDAKPLPAHVVGTTTGPLAAAAKLFYDRGCEYCHQIGGYGGTRGPDLTYIGDRLDKSQIVITIMNGGYNMPAYASVLTPEEVEDLSIFLSARKRGYSAAAR